MQEISTKTCEKKKKIKRKYQRERYPMDITLNERLKQYQRHYYTSKKTKLK